jgi:hypothetical protein
MRMPEPGLQPQPEDEEDEELLQSKPLVQRKSFATQDREAEPPASVHEVLRSPGQPLGTAERQFFEPRFGHDFGHVRVHTNALARESARAVHSRAYTVGRSIAFAEGQYSPATAEGKRLLSHELTHIVQQGTGHSIGSNVETVNRGFFSKNLSLGDAGYSPEAHSERGLPAHEITHVIQQQASSAVGLRSPCGTGPSIGTAPSGQLQRRPLTRQERQDDSADLKKAKRRLGILKRWLRRLQRKQLDPGPLRARWARWAILLDEAGEIDIEADYGPLVKTRIENLDMSASLDSGQSAARVPDHLPGDTHEADSSEPPQPLAPCDIGSVALAIDPLERLLPTIYLTDSGDMLFDQKEFNAEYLAYAEDACLVEIPLGEHAISWDFGDQGPALGSVTILKKRTLGKYSIPVKLTAYIIKETPCLPCFSGTFDWSIDFSLTRTFNAGKKSSTTASGSTFTKGSATASSCIHPPVCSIDRNDDRYPFNIDLSQQRIEWFGDLFDIELHGRVFYGGTLNGPMEPRPAPEPKRVRGTV